MRTTKFLTSILSATLLIGAVACGDSDDGDNNNNTNTDAGTDTDTGVGTAGGSVTISGKSFPVRLLPGSITTDTTLSAGTVWLMNGTVNVGTGNAQLNGGSASTSPTLTIEAGAQIMAVEDTASSLVITRGAKIDAKGTNALPIIMGAVAANTSATNMITGDVSDLTGRGQWGGVVLSGFGETNSGDSNGELATEAAPTGEERYFGGKDNADNSGTISHMIIAESGFEFRTDEEVQGLTIEAAGSGTTIEYVQVIGSEDDCIEWFGGAASASYLVCQGADDDGLDMDLGYVGNIQFAIVRIGAENGDRGIESDNNGDNFTATPVSAPNLANITILGNVGKKNKSYAALHREGFAGKVFRSVYTDDTAVSAAFPAGGLDVDDSLAAALQYRDVVINTTPVLVSDDDTFATEGQTNGQLSLNTATFSALSATSLAVTVTGGATPVEALPSGFAAADYFGAVDPSATAPWFAGWTYINSAVDANLPGADFHPLAAEIADGSLAPDAE